MLKLENMFVKAIYTSMHIQRQCPFGIAKSWAYDYEKAMMHGLPVPKLLGLFSVKIGDEGWLWNGILTEWLEGYEEVDPDDIESVERAAELLASNRSLPS